MGRSAILIALLTGFLFPIVEARAAPQVFSITVLFAPIGTSNPVFESCVKGRLRLLGDVIISDNADLRLIVHYHDLSLNSQLQGDMHSVQGMVIVVTITSRSTYEGSLDGTSNDPDKACKSFVAKIDSDILDPLRAAQK